MSINQIWRGQMRYNHVHWRHQVYSKKRTPWLWDKLRLGHIADVLSNHRSLFKIKKNKTKQNKKQRKNKKNKGAIWKDKQTPGLAEWLMVIALSSIIPFSPPFSKVFFTSIFNTLSPHMMYHMFEREWVSTGSHTLLWLVAKVSLSFTKIWMSPVSRNGPLLWVKFDFTSSNKSLLLFVALRKLCRDSAKMNFKSSQNCRRVKLAALGERG